MFRYIFILFLFNHSRFVVTSLKGGSSIKPKLRCQDGDQKVFSMDNLLKQKELEMFSNFLQMHRPWVLNYKDVYEKDFLDMHSNTTWVSPISLELFQRTRLWKVLSGVVKQLSTKDYFLCHAMFTMTQRMDFNPVSKDDRGIMVTIFLNGDMKKNSYGEKVFFNNNGDVLCSVHPVQGRIVIWNSSISYVPKPPSMLYLQRQNSIVMKLTDSHEKHQHCLDHHKENKKSILVEHRFLDFPFTVKKSDRLKSIELGNTNFGDHLTNRYSDSRGYEVAVFDDILTKSDLDLLRSHLVKDYYSIGFQPYDTDKTEDHDNVAWISAQKVDILVKSGLWNVVKQTVQYLTSSDEWCPYDVSMNIIHSFHHTRIHEDCETKEHEYTFLLYLNPDWDENDYGETVFFDLVHSKEEIAPGDQEYEIVAVVRPYYGRIVMFNGNIPHSARPPSPGFRGARYTFACKVSKTHRIAQAKQLQETIESLLGFGVDDPESEALWEELASGEHAITSEGRPDNFLETELAKQRQRLADWKKNEQERLLSKLCS